MSAKDNGELFGQTALVTGASRGIGKQIAIELAMAGALVIGTATNEDGVGAINSYLDELDLEGQGVVLDLRRGETELSYNDFDFSKIGLDPEVIAEITAGEKKVVIVNDVVSVVNSVYKKALSDAKDFWGDRYENAGKALQILVNNAGITRDGVTVRMPKGDWDDVIDVNLSGAFHVMQAALPDMMRVRYGRIVNNSSYVGMHGNPGQTNYAASKAGLFGMTKAVAKELGSRNILVNAVAPGYVETRLTEALPEEAKDAMISLTPVRSSIPEQQIARIVLNLASPNNTHVTGVVLPVDGGLGM